jgi:hypothetical protein
LEQTIECLFAATELHLDDNGFVLQIERDACAIRVSDGRSMPNPI